MFLSLYGGLDATGVGEGHAVELIEAPGVALYGEGTVDQALNTNRRDVLDADGLDVLSQPSAAQLHSVGVDYDDVVPARRSLNEGACVRMSIYDRVKPRPPCVGKQLARSLLRSAGYVFLFLGRIGAQPQGDVGRLHRL